VRDRRALRSDPLTLRTQRTRIALRRCPGYVERGAPVAIQRRDASGAWTRVAADSKLAIPGWMKTSALCP
jgi:hypothetical protein